MSALDELLSQWRSNPDADATIALCSFLGNSSREELIREVSASAETWHAEDGRVMLAVGRMHLDAGLLAEAQAALVAAGKADGRDAKPFRYLGEVLLRRGDALRAEKVLARSLQLGPNDGEARLWHDRAVVYSALQKRIGVEAVAAEVLRTMPKQNSIPPPTVQPLSHKGFGNEELTKARAQNPMELGKKAKPAPMDSLPRFESEEPLRISGSDLIEESKPQLSPMARAARMTTLGMGPPGPKLPSGPAPKATSVAASRAPSVAAKSPSLAARANPAPRRAPDPPPARFEEVITTVTPAPFVAPSWPEPVAAAPAPPLPSVRPPLPKPSVPPPPPAIASRAPALPAARAELQSAETEAFEQPYAAPSVRPRPPNPPPAPAFSDTGQPDPGLVLEHLSRVGVYEPGGGAPPAWENPTRQKTRGTWTLSVAIGLIAAAGTGSYFYSQKIRSERLQHASALNDQVKKLLETGSVSDLRQTDQKLNESFEPDSLSPLAARLWLQNRVLYEVLTSDEVRGIDSAVHRG
ncbi:MAG TPA: hypothetical protein VHW01_11045, partial [Polyangiaceae bacterium]|nr:hypothetical protein [Polyangiaceae bacterium]